jgi:hypothetical protein
MGTLTGFDEVFLSFGRRADNVFQPEPGGRAWAISSDFQVAVNHLSWQSDATADLSQLQTCHL